MEYVKLGESDLKVSAIGLGLWQVGTNSWGWGKTYSREESISAIHRALDLGLNLFDTAEIYGMGLSEKVLGEALRDRRDEAIISDKVWPTHAWAGGVINAAKKSLQRIGTRYIDLYQIHWPNPIVPLGETMRGMQELHDAGLIHYVGVSNFGLNRVRRARAQLTSAKLVSNQVAYNLIQNGPSEKLLPHFRKENLSIIAYSPLAQGLLSGKYTPGIPPKIGIRRFNPLFSPTNMRRVEGLIEVLREISLARGMTVSQVALNWLIRDERVVAIPGAKTAEQVDEVAGAAGWRLTDSELLMIEEALAILKIEYLKSIPRMLLRALFRI